MARMNPERLSTLTAQHRDVATMEAGMRYLSCLSATHGNVDAARDLLADRWPRSVVHREIVRKAFDDVDVQTKALIAVGATSDQAWAGSLVPQPLVAPLLTHTQQQSLLGRIVGAQRVPFLARVPIQTNSGNYYWIAEGIAKRATKLGFASSPLAKGKISGIIVLSHELVRLSEPFGETAMRDALTGGLVAFQDAQLIDPTVSLIPNERPAAITFGLTPVASTGNLNADVAKLLSTFYAARPTAQRPSLIMSPANAGALAAGGQHPDLRVDGGYAFGVPVYTSAGAANRVVALDAAALLYSDGGLLLDVSREAEIELDDAPVGTAAGVLTSLWQGDLVGYRAERMLWWLAAPNSVQLLTVTP